MNRFTKMFNRFADEAVKASGERLFRSEPEAEDAARREAAIAGTAYDGPLAALVKQTTGTSLYLSRTFATDPQPVAVGEKYHLHVWPDGLEQHLAIHLLQPPAYAEWAYHHDLLGRRDVQGVLTVTVIAVLPDGSAVEETGTCCILLDLGEGYSSCTRVLPRGRGWEVHNATKERHTRFRRTRTWGVAT